MSANRLIEHLESRRLMAAPNLIRNGDAESGIGSADGGSVTSIPEWTFVDSAHKATVVQYGATGGFPTSGSPGPSNRGAKFFAGGNGNAASAITQNIDLSSLATDIDGGRIKVTLSGYFGGVAAEDDTPVLQGLYLNGAGTIIGSPIQTGSVSAADRSNVTSLLFKTSTGTIPKGARSIRVELNMLRQDFTYNDAYADNLSLTLSSTLGNKARVAGKILADAAGAPNGRAVKNVKVFLDKDNDGKLDSGEPSALTNTKGRYAFENISPDNDYVIRAILPSGYRNVAGNGQALSVLSGLTTEADILLSQSAVITGIVFNDSNGNGKRDSSETGIRNEILFLDFNDNGEIDTGEPTSKSNSKGVCKFVAPFGKYIIRVAESSTKPVAASGSTRLLVTVAKGQTRTVHFEMKPA